MNEFTKAELEGNLIKLIPQNAIGSSEKVVVRVRTDKDKVFDVEDIKIGDRLEIHCYKHNGKIHRTWDEATILEITDDYIVCGNYKTYSSYLLC